MGVNRILIVDDEPAIRTALSRALQLEGYDVDVVPTGEAALTTLDRSSFDLVLLDVSMPGIDGLEVCRRLRDGGDTTPVIVVTARSQVADSVAGLDAGADDYVVKPFALDELLARLRALLRRSGGAKGVQQLRYADLVLDPATLTATRGELRIDLTRTEFALLHLFMRNPNKILSKRQIFEDVWGYDFGNTSNSHEIYVGYLRRKTEANGDPRLIHTVRGSGYVMREADGA
ncbi:MAG: two component transcriptional regulator, winged helix family [Thermoleophilia bacterium]|nr:two component transcriptional regulator, winged helix family [Thermoleophilia bacterium]